MDGGLVSGSSQGPCPGFWSRFCLPWRVPWAVHTAHRGLGSPQCLGRNCPWVFVYPRQNVKTSGNREGEPHRTPSTQLPTSTVFLAHSDYVVQFEEDQFQPGVWHDHSKFPGSVNSAILQLSPYVNYQFRVIAINEVGSSHPSLPSERYRTSGAREYLRANGPQFLPMERGWVT